MTPQPTPQIPMEKIRHHVENILKLQPFMTLLNLKIDTLERGSVQLSIPYDKKLTQHHGFIHGGVIGALADCACAVAGGSVTGDLVTQEYKLNFLAPAKADHFIVRANVIRAGKRQTVCSADVYAITNDQKNTKDQKSTNDQKNTKNQEKHIATAMATLMPVDYTVAQ